MLFYGDEACQRGGGGGPKSFAFGATTTGPRTQPKRALAMAREIGCKSADVISGRDEAGGPSKQGIRDA